MSMIHKALVVLSWTGTGILMPVTALLLLARGCGLPSVGILMGLYSLTVIAVELPSGVAADLIGRKKCYLISCVLSGASVLLLYAAHTVWLLAPAMALQGLGRAFSSGSLEALIIEQSLQRQKGGPNALSRVTSQMFVCQGLGVAIGALAGGWLPAGSGYSRHLVVRMTLIIITFVMTLALVSEEDEGKKSGQGEGLAVHFRTCIRLLRGERTLPLLLACIGVCGIALIAVESYWQPAFSALEDNVPQSSLGILCASGFAASTLGSFAAGYLPIRTEKRRWRSYLLLLASFAAILLLFSLRTGTVGFACCYIGIYLVLGIAAVPEQTILNGAAPDRLRASMMSLASLSGQMGGVLSGVLCGAAVNAVGIAGIWRICGILTLLTVVLTNVILLIIVKHKSTK